MARVRSTRALLCLALLALALSSTACVALLAKDAGGNRAAKLVGSTWMTMTVDGVSVPVDVESTLTFASETKLTGNGGCNAFSATISMAANEIDMGPIVKENRSCAPYVMAAESSFLAALQTVRSFRGTDLFLYLSDGVGTQRISLSRVPETELSSARSR
jgi:heat shock protein HslJ